MNARALTLPGKRARSSSGPLGLAIILTFSLAVAVHHYLYRDDRTREFLISQMLYLPSGKYLRPVSFGYQTLLADYIYLWSIQYYGDPGFHPRMEYLKHTYDLITELDPHFLDAYQTGALFMFYEGRNPSAGLWLLNKGLERNPNEWILPTDAGFYCIMNLRDYKLAASYFEKASKIPGAPSLVKRMQAGAYFRMGDMRVAHQLWQEVYDTAEKASIKQTAFQHVHDLKIMIDLEDIRKAIALFHSKFQRYPLNLNQLVSAGILRTIPRDPEENSYVYDPQTGNVDCGSQLKVYKRFQ